MNYFKLARTPLFAGTTEEEIKQMLTCLKAVERNYKKGETIYCAGDVTTEIGLVLSGSVLIENVDAWGNWQCLGQGRRGEDLCGILRLRAGGTADGQCDRAGAGGDPVFGCHENASDLSERLEPSSSSCLRICSPFPHGKIRRLSRRDF